VGSWDISMGPCVELKKIKIFEKFPWKLNISSFPGEYLDKKFLVGALLVF
jgi:hypothetical protein